MDKKISLDLATQHYYLHIPSAQGQHIFNSVFDYDVLIRSLVQQSGLALYGYCLFPESLHLLVLSNQAPSKWLEPWLMSFNQWHQETHNVSGYLFDDEHTRLVLIQPKHLSKTLRYIHYLPIQHKLCSAPEQYLYSSYHDYVGDQDTGVNTKPILSALSPHYGQRLRRFHDYMAVANQEPNDVFNSGNHPYYLAYSDELYLTQARASYQSKHSFKSESEHNGTWQQCIEKLIELQGLEVNHWLGLQRHHSFPDAHFLLAWLFVKVANGPIWVAAKQLGIDEATIKLKINSIALHHPAKFLRYIKQSWETTSA